MVERGWQKWMDETNYGKGGTKDKTLKIRGNPKECSAIVPLGHVLRASERLQTPDVLRRKTFGMVYSAESDRCCIRKRSSLAGGAGR